MRKTVFLLAAIVATFSAKSQDVADFENPVLAVDSSWFGQDQITDGDTIYTDAYLNFELNYNSAWGSFTGWSVSNRTDVVTAGFSNQFSAIAGGGANGSSQYGVCYVSAWSNNRVFMNNIGGDLWSSIDVTNTTYAYLSMLNGDAFAKPFGADTSAAGINDGTNGEDWFLLTIYALGNDSLRNGDSINFYLADYRFANNTEDYLVDSWETVDLTSFNNNSGGIPIGLDFVLNSSDTSGGFGMNTPSYFAVDRVQMDYSFDLGELNDLEDVKAYPNPTNGFLNINTDQNSTLFLYDFNGRLIKQETAKSTRIEWDLDGLDNGIYLLVLSDGISSKQVKIIKQ